MLATAAAKLTIANAYQASVVLLLTGLLIGVFVLVFFEAKGGVSIATGSFGSVETLLSVANLACGRLITGSPKLSR